jgi:hypothetical protein
MTTAKVAALTPGSSVYLAIVAISKLAAPS